MRRVRSAAVVWTLACVGGALATPTVPKLTWADWVGDWDGKLKWTNCTIDGEPHATLSFDASDGAVAIDLTPAGGALGRMTLTEDGAGWLGKQGDVTVHVTRAAATLEVAVDLLSTCAMRGTLRRASVGIAACDELDAWARIEGRCTKLSKPPLENTARLVHQHAEWAKTQGEARTKLALQCKARSTKVETELVDAGCAPNPDPTIGMRDAECGSLRQLAAKFSRCGQLPSDLTTAIAREAIELSAGAQTADTDAALHVVEARCKLLRERLVDAALQVGCPP